jgi:hypothetical protein
MKALKNKIQFAGGKLEAKTNFEVVLYASLSISASRAETRRRMTNSLAKAFNDSALRLFPPLC